MKLVSKPFSFLLYSNIFIALCAAALVLQTSILTGLEFPPSVYFFVFFSTLLEYNIQRLLVLFRFSNVPPEPRYVWLHKNKLLFYFLFVISVLCVVYFFFQLPYRTWMWAGFSGLLTILYSFPLIPTVGGFKRLRALPHMKIITISLVWTLSTMFLPFSSVGENYQLLILSGVIRFLFVLAITIPFDARDVHADSKRGLKTIPLVFGVDRSYQIATYMLGVVALLGLVSHFGSDNFYGISMIITSVLTITFIRGAGWRGHPFYYYGLLDGTMLLAPLINYILAEYFIQ